MPASAHQVGSLDSPPGSLPRPWRGRLLVALAALLWSTSGFFAKTPWIRQWPVEEQAIVLAFWRALAAGCVLLPWTRSRKWTIGLLPAGLSFALMNFAFLRSLTYCGESTALWLQYTSPLWVFLMGVYLFGERARRRDYAMLAGILMGVLTIVVPPLWEGPATSLTGAGIRWGLLSGVALAGVFVSLRQLRSFESQWVVAFCHLFAAACMLPLVVAKTHLPTVPELAWLTAFGAFQMGLPYVLFSTGLKDIPAHEGSCLALLEPLLVSLWVYLAWGHLPDYEPPQVSTLVGGGLILLSLLAAYARPK